MSVLFSGPIWRVPVFGARMLIFTSYWPVIDEFLNTTFQLSPSNFSGISHTLHVQRGGSKLWSVSVSRDKYVISDSHSTSSYILHIWEIKKKSLASVMYIYFLHFASGFCNL
jgi:hypothetical protein